MLEDVFRMAYFTAPVWLLHYLRDGEVLPRGEQTDGGSFAGPLARQLPVLSGVRELGIMGRDNRT